MLRRALAWLFVILAIAGIGGGLGFYKYSEIQNAIAASQTTPEPMESVRSIRAREGQWRATTRAIGSVVAIRQVEIKNEIAGMISEIGFKSGEVVDKGALLVQFDVRQELAALSAAQADTRLSKLTLERREALRNSAAFNEQETDKSREEHAAANARAQNLQVIVDKKRITAPFRARVGIIDWQPGAYLDVGTRIVTLQGVDPDAYVDFSLAQDDAAAIRAGTLVKISDPAIPGGEATAEIIAEDNSADGTSRAVRFRAVAKGLGSALRPGTFVDVTVETSKPQSAVMVPLASVRRSPSGQHVFVLVDEAGKLRARQRPVQTGMVQGDEIAIVKGLEIGELIAASGSFKLREGLLVDAEVTSTPETGAVSVN
ncbi:efflux RND transporter periplasmic adaptor subunit [Hyphomicrobium sp.]|uniref:efflux RND transporter periplasmic adaptor subunit n=1 Tax=Hyphomicrobium sp. TaxID=82 RepID=UPI002E32F9F2|nr:efflux RND transporter periplasmic adaptor subunit [Hyphomicrobium sp.]HEX2842844.1 efflux RND transporter periplasmic adaptor subunit [Hyphomicrobium sp.]